mmetsp:Transcript_1771/g.3904  ORF Transcript_1771/g.3904 Transcript_1771/m.3904 type:complete len:318 (-) Transcript_1771:203-1156(-)
MWPVFPAVVELLASMRADNHLGGHHNLLVSPELEPVWLQPVRLRIGIPLAILLYAQFPDCAVRRELLQACGDVADGLPTKNTPVSAKLPVHLLQQHGGILVAWVFHHAELQVDLGLVPKRVGIERLGSPIERLLVLRVLVQDLVREVLDPAPLLLLYMQLRHVIPEKVDQCLRLRRRFAQGQEHLDTGLPLVQGLIQPPRLEGLIALLLEGGLHSAHAEGLVARKVAALNPGEVRGLLLKLASPIVLLFALLVDDLLHLVLGRPDLLFLVLVQLSPFDVARLFALLEAVLPYALEPAVVQAVKSLLLAQQRLDLLVD